MTTTPSNERRAVLVTGAAGYIGRLVVEALASDRRGFETIVGTDVVPWAGRSAASTSQSSVDVRDAAAEMPAGVLFEKLDVRERDAVSDVVARHGIDTVVHLAAIVTPPKGMSDDVAYAVDVDGTRNVLDACLAHGASKVIVTSSGAAYGYHADSSALLDEDCPLRGNDEFAYSRHKRLVEEMLARYRKEHPELQQLVLRPGTILGPRVKNQITAIFERPVVLGLRDAATPFCFVWDRDVVAAILAGVHGEHHGIYNLSGDGVMTLREIAQRLGKRYVAVPSSALGVALGALRRLGLTQLGPEQVRFLQYRPVLGNARLKRDLGLRPTSSREVFEIWCAGRDQTKAGATAHAR